MVEIVLDDALETCEELEQECQPKAKLFQLNPSLARMVARRAAWLRETVKTARLAIEGEGPPQKAVGRLLARWIEFASGSRIVCTLDYDLLHAEGPVGEYEHLANVHSVAEAAALVAKKYPAFRRVSIG